MEKKKLLYSLIELIKPFSKIQFEPKKIMSISLKQITLSFGNLTECIGIVCNGEIEVTSNLKERLQNCRAIIGVDGGLNHCKKMNINPQWIVGDFDSIDPVLLEEFKKRPDFTILPKVTITDPSPLNFDPLNKTHQCFR